MSDPIKEAYKSIREPKTEEALSRPKRVLLRAEDYSITPPIALYREEVTVSVKELQRIREKQRELNKVLEEAGIHIRYEAVEI